MIYFWRKLTFPQDPTSDFREGNTMGIRYGEYRQDASHNPEQTYFDIIEPEEIKAYNPLFLTSVLL